MSVPITNFRRVSQKNLQRYPRCLQFWWPIIDNRAKRYESSAFDLLLNPVFRWIFLNRVEKLKEFENQLKLLKDELGTTQYQLFHKQLLQDISNHPIENEAHNRLLSAMIEIHTILRFTSEEYTITLIPRRNDQRTPDFRADKGSQSCMVEVKYIRPPDKLDEYLMRWWQAQKEVINVIPQGRFPHLKFDWEPIESRDDLSNEEITSLKNFFAGALQQPEKDSELTTGRLNVRYIHNRKLPTAIVPLHIKANHSETAREGLFQKLIRILDDASGQIINSNEVKHRIIFLAINLSTDIQFLWAKHFYKHFDILRQNYEKKGLKIIVEEVGYL